MDFDFSDELELLRDTARSFLHERCPPAAARRVIDTGADLDPVVWSEMARMGWLAASVPETYGGLGLGHLALCVLAEELGRVIAPVPFHSSACLATDALLLFGSPEQKSRLLPRLASGATTGTFACVERAGPYELEGFDATVANSRLSGTKSVVMDAGAAQLAIVAARGEDGEPALYIASLEAPGVIRSPREGIDPSRRHASIRFEAVEIERLPGSSGARAIERLVDRAAVVMAFEQLGVAEAALEMARDYAKARYAFGRPIGSFQAIKHKLADVYVAVELARSSCFYGAWALERDADELPIAAAVSRVAACEAGWLATKENIQTHGGMGFTWELDCHLYYRRAKLLGLALGSAREWKRTLMARLRHRAGAPAAA